MKCSLVSLNFLKRSLVFPIVLFSSISLHWSLRKAFLNLSLLFFGTLHSDEHIFPFLLCHWVLFFSQLFVWPPQTTVLPFCISFSWGWSLSLPLVQYHEAPFIVLQALFLSDLIPWIYLSLLLHNCKGFDLGHTWMAFTINCGKFWKKWEYQTTWPASSETCMQVRKQQLELDWYQIGNGVCQGCILSPCLFNLYAEHIMRNAGLVETQA